MNPGQSGQSASQPGRRSAAIARTVRTFQPLAWPTPADEAAMRNALMLAADAARFGEVPVGAVIYETRTGAAVAQASNRRECDHDPAAHAELIAIRDAAKARGDWRLSGCTLVVTLEPCIMCAGAIVNARIDRVVFGATDPKAGGVHSLYRLLADPRLNHRPQVIGGLLADECGSQLKSFFRSLRNRAT